MVIHAYGDEGHVKGVAGRHDLGTGPDGADEFHLLFATDCGTGRGFLFAPPMPLERAMI
jgi:hypothetical protein